MSCEFQTCCNLFQYLSMDMHGRSSVTAKYTPKYLMYISLPDIIVYQIHYNRDKYTMLRSKYTMIRDTPSTYQNTKNTLYPPDVHIRKAV